jgi:hypothetical protein
MRLRHLVCLALVACGGGGPPEGPIGVEIASVRELGVVRNPALGNVLRDGGASGRVDGRMLWTFGDTRFPFQAEDGLQYRSNSAAYASLETPTVLSEPLDARGAPRPLLPFNAEELAYNAASGRPDERYALWPTAVLPIGENGYVLYTRLKIHPGALDHEQVSTGMAFVRQGATQGERLPEIFTVPEPQFHHAAVNDTGVMHLFACSPSTSRCRVARAPLERMTERAAYEFWTGAGWSPDAGRAVEEVPGTTTGFSITYNSYLERFVALESKPFSGRIVLRTAQGPEGPWSEDLFVHDAGAPIHATTQHVELAAEAGRRFFFSYYMPDGDLRGEVRLVEVTLR